MTVSDWLTDEQLCELLERYFEGKHHEDGSADQLRTLVERAQDEVFNHDVLATLSDELLVERLVSIYHAIVSVPMYYKAIENHPAEMRAALQYLLKSEDGLPAKVDALLTSDGHHKIGGLGKSFWSIFFMALGPDQNPRWTGKTDKALADLGAASRTRGDSPGQVYMQIAEVERALATLHPQADLFDIDHLMHYVVVLEGKDILKTWRGISPPSPAVKEGDLDYSVRTRYWKIAPGRDAWNWEACRDGGFIAMGWDALGDLSALTRNEFESLRDKLVAERDDYKTQGVNQAWTFSQIREGDRVVANRGTKEILGIGTIVGPYYFVPGERHGHRLPVRWDDLAGRTVDQGGWRRTLIELDKALFDKIVGGLPPEPVVSVGAPFSAEAFRLLGDLHEEPTHDFYTAHKDALRTHVIDPLKDLMLAVRDYLPLTILDAMETDKWVFANILKQFAAQGCWDFYWGAFYPKGGKRTEDAQLFLWINADRLDYGFYIGQYGSEQRERFLTNCQDNHDVLVRDIAPDLPELNRLVFGEPGDFVGGQDSPHPSRDSLSFADWLANPVQAGIRTAIITGREEVLQLTSDALARDIASVYQSLFPLVLLATLDDPMPAIGRYLGPAPEPVVTRLYPLSECALETGFDESHLASWVRAIERKGQAIIYGPPGTGKTYVAEHLAKHLIGGGDGFCELVQFHPAYAYEDFIQGIRPKPKGDGQLHYPVVPGRFLDFCESAKECHDRCVMIVDEINRANLARVFGELMYLLEYRDREIPLAAGGELRIPRNVRIIGTMNTADRSIALVDHALRRRFAFLRLEPNLDILRHYHESTGFDVEPLVRVLKRLNNEIDDPHYSVGITFFLRKQLSDDIRDIWRMEIEPYLDEYFFDQRHKADAFRWEKVAGELGE